MTLSSRFALIAVSILALNTASAALLSTTDPYPKYSSEGLLTPGDTGLPTVAVIIAADYAAGDDIEFRITGATIAGKTGSTATMSCGAVLSIEYLQHTGTAVRFRVTGANQPNLGATCYIDGIWVTKASLAASTLVTGTYSVRTPSGESIDIGCADAGSPSLPRPCAPGETPNVVTIARIHSQFNSGVRADLFPFNGILDESSDFTTFKYEDELTQSRTGDTLWVKFANYGDALEAVPGVSMVLKLRADFSFAAGRDGVCGTGDDVGVVLSDLLGKPAIFEPDCSAARTEYELPDGVYTAPTDRLIVLIPEGSKATRLTPQSFRASCTFSYEGNQSVEQSFAAGAWTIEGASVFVPYLPYRSDIRRIVYLANYSGRTGSIVVSAFDEAGRTYRADVRFVAGHSVFDLGPVISNALIDGGFQFPGKVSVLITTSLRTADFGVHAGYEVGGTDRATVVTSQIISGGQE